MGNTLNSYLSIYLIKSITASQSSNDIFLITETYTRVVLNEVLLLLKGVRGHELVLFDNFFCLLAPHKISYNTYTRELLNMCSLSTLFSNIKSQRLRCSISCPLGERVLACHLSSANHIPQLRTWNADGQNSLVTVSTMLMTCSSSVQNRLLLLKMVVSLSRFQLFHPSELFWCLPVFQTGPSGFYPIYSLKSIEKIPCCDLISRAKFYYLL